MSHLKPEEIEYHFAGLKYKLATQKLPCSDGTTRYADADEFMLMHISEEGMIGFKHHDTRNYVFLSKDHQRLIVPQTSEAFMRGHFEIFEELPQ